MDPAKDQPELPQHEPDVKQEIESENANLKQENGTAAGELVSDEVVRERLLSLLASSDLATTTEKMLRKQLETELGVKLGDRKALIRDEVLAYLAKKREEEGLEGGDEDEDPGDVAEEEEEEQPQPKKRKSGGSGFGSGLSPQLQEFLGVESMPRPQVVKAIWAYIRQNNLQDPSDKRKIIVDEKLSKFLTHPVGIFSMNKQLSNHCFKQSTVIDSSAAASDEEPKQRPAKKPKATSSTSSSKAAANGKSKGDDEKPRTASGFAKPLRLSDELAAATGETEMSRGAVQKWLFEYAKKNDLLDPSNKQFVLSDETLKNLTGETRFKAFGSQKLFSKHFVK